MSKFVSVAVMILCLVTFPAKADWIVKDLNGDNTFFSTLAEFAAWDVNDIQRTYAQPDKYAEARSIHVYDPSGPDYPVQCNTHDGGVVIVREFPISTFQSQDLSDCDFHIRVVDAFAPNFFLDLTDPSDPSPDTTAPVLTLIGPGSVNVDLNTTYTDQGATALDDTDGDITGNIVVVNPVNINLEGTYTVTYNVNDAAGNSAAQITRTVFVIDNSQPDTTPPVITLNGSSPVNIETGSSYNDSGATAVDNIDGDITGFISVVSSVNTTLAGSYQVTYNVTDSSGNPAIQVTRTVVVTDMVEEPVASNFNDTDLIRYLVFIACAFAALKGFSLALSIWF